ncbi:MAG TPA: L-2-hydroxyglutarate oxidase [Acidimicrobiia bacterium]|nr:L-2-hydroxyglutarate oxidase [Acidimicrobiia bacterium]
MTQPDVVVIGAGIVGLATALALTERGARVTVVDKENQVAAHQTGHNSGVIHTGIYYKPGSHKAKLCVDGRARLLQFCQQEGIPTKTPGKVVVATSDSQIPALDELHRRAEANGVEGVRRIDPTQLRALEPNATGVVALHVPGAGTVDFRQVAAAMQRRLVTAGGQVQTGAEVKSASRIGSLWTLSLDGMGEVKAPRVVACAGLQSDRMARLLGLNPQLRIVPFRGEYWHLRRPDLVNGLIYPVPDPQFPFLGVHFTKGIDGAVEVGPNAVLAFAREGYSWGRIVPHELREILATPGLATLARRYWRIGAGEIARSLIPALQIRAARQLVPAIRRGDLVRAGAGVRAQALSPDGSLVDDFAFAEGEGVLSVLNAPSPAATASLAIGEEIATRILSQPG